MKIFFSGNHFKNNGPCEINKNLLKILKGKVSYIKCINPYIRLFEILIKIVFCDIVIFSGISSYDHYSVKWAKMLNKRIIYIMHGCLALEYAMNNNNTNNQALKNENILLNNSDLILCVSKMYSKIIASHYPQFSYKINVLTNCIDWEKMPTSDTNPNHKNNQIILIGGGRCTKRNLTICQAVQSINEQYNKNLKINVYGYFQKFDDSIAISKIPCVTFHPVISHDELLNEFKHSQLFIQNSDLESFSLGVIESLCCGCDILISQHVGAKDIIKGIENCDLITDTHDIEQIKNKIMWILCNGNNYRLLNSIDKIETNIEFAANKLIRFAQDLYTK